MGSSTTFAIVTGPLSLVHIFTNVYVSCACLTSSRDNTYGCNAVHLGRIFWLAYRCLESAVKNVLHLHRAHLCVRTQPLQRSGESSLSVCICTRSCLWSGLLSLSFDDLFTSPAGCTSYTPNGSYRNVPIGSAAVNGSIADQLCDNQTALVSMVFVGLMCVPCLPLREPLLLSLTDSPPQPIHTRSHRLPLPHLCQNQPLSIRLSGLPQSAASGPSQIASPLSLYTEALCLARVTMGSRCLYLSLRRGRVSKHAVHRICT